MTVYDPIDYSLPDPSVHGIFRQEYWIELLSPFPGNLYTGIQSWSPVFPALTGSSLSLCHLGSPSYYTALNFGIINKAILNFCICKLFNYFHYFSRKKSHL